MNKYTLKFYSSWRFITLELFIYEEVLTLNILKSINKSLVFY